MKLNLHKWILKATVAFTLMIATTGWSQAYYNLQWPPTGNILESMTHTVYAQAWEPGLTSESGPATGLQVWIGISPKGQNTNPNTWTMWIPASYNGQSGENDEYMAAIGSNLSPGTYYYASRFNLNGGGFNYGGYPNGAWNGTSQTSGVLTVGSNPDCTAVWYLDADNDGYGTSAGTVTGCNKPDGYSSNATDCDDNNAGIFQSSVLFVDNDGDNYTVGTAEAMCYGNDVPEGYSATTLGTDCDDDDSNAYTTGDLYIDDDGDGYTNGVVTSVCYGPVPDGYSISSLGNDCDDTNPNAWRVADMFVDADGDNYSVGFESDVCYGTELPEGYSLTSLGEDCNDDNDQAYPDAPEIAANGIDENCNGMEDDGAGDYFTQLRASHCGGTLTRIYQSLLAETIPENVTQYFFEVTDSKNMVQIFSSSTYYFQLTDLPFYEYGTTYSVRVGLEVDNVWQGYGSSCDVTTPSLTEGATAIVIPQCGTTLAQRFSPIFITGPNFISSYEIMVTNLNTSETAMLTRTTPWFTLKMLPSIYDYDSDYSIQVRVATTGGYSEWSAACTVSTPDAPAAKVANTAVNLTAVAYPNPFSGEFSLNLANSNGTAAQVKVYDMLGKVVEVREIDAKNNNAQQIGNNLPAGVYNVVVTQDGVTDAIRVIKR